jgi:hypothetical protein
MPAALYGDRTVLPDFNHCVDQAIGDVLSSTSRVAA